ncbi:MAG: proline--tRNA ligase, partial [Planctomycetota bacterium]
RIFARCGIPAIPIEAESGPIGGSGSHEFTVPCDAGEDIILTSDKGNYAANVEKAETGERPHDFAKPAETDRPMMKQATRGTTSVEDVASVFALPTSEVLKTMVFRIKGGTGSFKWVFAVVRGDRTVNQAKLSGAVRDLLQKPEHEAVSVEPVSDVELKGANFPVGCVGPTSAATRSSSLLLIDPEAAQTNHTWVVGADEVDHHFTFFHWQRDFISRFGKVLEAKQVSGSRESVPPRFLVADIRDAVDGDPSPKGDGGVLKESRGIEVGHVFKLGTKYSEPLGATVLTEDQKQLPILMGCYGIGVGRILISAVETSHDDRGIIWPKALAPYDVVITPIKYEGDVAKTCDDLAAKLAAEGLDVLLDDRDERPGSKFADADLIGMPVRIVVGDRGLKEGKVELKARRDAEASDVAVDDVVTQVVARLDAMER